MSEEEKTEDQQTIRINHYRNLIQENSRMSKSHMRVFEHWYPRIGAPLAYELARVAYNNDKRYQMLKVRHATS